MSDGEHGADAPEDGGRDRARAADADDRPAPPPPADSMRLRDELRLYAGRR